MYVQIAPLPANTLTRKLTTPTHITHIHFEISKNQTDEFISSVTAEKEEIDKKARRMKEEDDMAHRVTGMSAKSLTHPHKSPKCPQKSPVSPQRALYFRNRALYLRKGALLYVEKMYHPKEKDFIACRDKP